MSESPLSQEVFERLLKRERSSRKEAERLLDQKSVELYHSNVSLRALADKLELRVQERTAELESERNRAVASAEALRESERRFTDVANIVGEYLWELDANFCFSSVTDQVTAVLGYAEQDLLGRSIFDYMPTDDATQMRKALKAAETDGQVFTNLAHRALTIDGEVVWQRSSGALSLDASGRVTIIRGASLDVSEQERSKEQMQQLVIALQHASEAIVMTSHEGAILFANDACARMFAYPSRERLIGSPWQQFYGPAEAQRFEAELATKLKVGEGFSGEGTGLREDGTKFPVHFSFNRLPNGELLWICRDESERLKTLMSLQTQNSLLTALIENIRVGVLFEDASAQRGLLFNQKIARVMGLESAAFEGLQRANPLFSQLRPRCHSASSKAVLEQLIELKDVCYNMLLDLDEDTCLVVDRIPVYVGAIYRGALWTIRDVSEEKRHERDMLEARQRAEAGDRAKSTFLANMSHEIRTPLNGICGMARILIGTSLDHDAFEQVRAIQVSADSLLHVLNDILDFAKVEAGQLDLEIVDFDFAQVLDSAFIVLHGRAIEKQLRFDFIYPDAGISMLKGDPSRLNEVLLNLIGNAIKFTATGGVTVVSRIVSEADDSLSLKLSIRDTGIGMSSEEMERVFEPFIQADSSISRRFGGSGLGLSICRDLVQLMGGTLSVESELGEGSEFIVQIPLERSDAELGFSEDEQLLERPVFMVTDSDDFYRVVDAMLAYAGERLVRVRDAAEVCIGLASCPTDAVLLLDRAHQGDYEIAEDNDLLCPMPEGLRRVLISDTIPVGGLNDTFLLAYPFSRYKLLNTIYTQLGLQLPQELFQGYTPQPFSELDLSGLRILLAEDNAINQRVACITIERYGAVVDVAANGREALEMVERFEYDLILMDIRMPEMDGVEACLRIRSRGMKLPIYALTAEAMKGSRERFIEAGMNGYLSKPLVEADLVNLLIDNKNVQMANGMAARANEDGEKLFVSDAQAFANKLWEEARESPVLALQDFYDLLDGEQALAHTLLLEFSNFAIDCARQAMDGLDAGDLNLAISRFHKLGGSAATIYAKQASASFLSLEGSLMEEPADKATCKSRISECMQRLDALCVEIEMIAAGDEL
jgi:two-component system, sensor histidine kinase and response regulator